MTFGVEVDFCHDFFRYTLSPTFFPFVPFFFSPLRDGADWSLTARLDDPFRHHAGVDGGTTCDLRWVQGSVAAVDSLTRPTLGAPRRDPFPQAAMASL